MNQHNPLWIIYWIYVLNMIWIWLRLHFFCMLKYLYPFLSFDIKWHIFSATSSFLETFSAMFRCTCKEDAHHKYQQEATSIKMDYLISSSWGHSYKKSGILKVMQYLYIFVVVSESASSHSHRYFFSFLQPKTKVDDKKGPTSSSNLPSIRNQKLPNCNSTSPTSTSSSAMPSAKAKSCNDLTKVNNNLIDFFFFTKIFSA